jgi:hypothetical protein
MSHIDSDDLIFYNDENGEIHSGGFNVNSVLMKMGLSPITTLNGGGQNGDNVGDLFKDIVIPSWAIYLPSRGGNKLSNDNYNTNDDDDEFIDEDLHDKLLNLVKPKENVVKKQDTKENNKNKLLAGKKTKKQVRREKSSKKLTKRHI